MSDKDLIPNSHDGMRFSSSTEQLEFSNEIDLDLPDTLDPLKHEQHHQSDMLLIENQQLKDELLRLRQEHSNLLHSRQDKGEPANPPAPAIKQYQAEIAMAKALIHSLEEQCTRYESRLATMHKELTQLRFSYQRLSKMQPR